MLAVSAGASLIEAKWWCTYSSVFAEGLFEVAVGSALAQARDMEVVAGVVVTVVAISAVLAKGVKECQW